MKICAYLICKNEESVIERLLKSLSFCDEVIVVDTGSADRTKEIAGKYALVYDFKWIDDFSAAKRYALERAEAMNPDWTIWFDADEEVKPEHGKLIRERLEKIPQDIDAVLLNWYFKLDENDKPLIQLIRERIIRAGKGITWGDLPIHEIIEIAGHKYVEWKDIPIYHYRKEWKAGRNLKIMRKCILNPKYANKERFWYYLANEEKENGNTKEAIVAYEKYLTMAWWDEEKYFATVSLAKCYLANGNIKKAKEIAEDAFKVREDLAENTFLLGEIAFQEKRYIDAIRWFKACLIKVPDVKLSTYLPFYESEPLRLLSHCYNFIGDIESARRYTIDFLKINPDSENYLFNLNLYNTSLKTKENPPAVKVGWLTPPCYDNGTTRIRRLQVHEELNRQGKVKSGFLWKDGLDYHSGFECNAVVFCSFGKTELEWMKRYKKAGIRVIYDHNEGINGFPFQKETMEEADLVVCCSHKLIEFSLDKISPTLNCVYVPDNWV